MIKITCVNCGMKLEAPGESAGDRGECPRCSEVFDVPGNPDLVCQEPSKWNEGAFRQAIPMSGALNLFLHGN